MLEKIIVFFGPLADTLRLLLSLSAGQSALRAAPHAARTFDRDCGNMLLQPQPFAVDCLATLILLPQFSFAPPTLPLQKTFKPNNRCTSRGLGSCDYRSPSASVDSAGDKHVKSIMNFLASWPISVSLSLSLFSLSHTYSIVLSTSLHLSLYIYVSLYLSVFVLYSLRHGGASRLAKGSRVHAMAVV